jgi:hypothetical protein
MLASYDRRTIRQELSDSGSPVTDGDLADNTVLQQLLDEAADIIKSSAMVGKRYTPENLTALAASATEGFFLRRLNSDIAYGLLMSRRGRAASDIARLAPLYVIAHDYLKQLRSGELIFGGVDATTYPEAGLPSLVDMTAANPDAPQSLLSRNVRYFGINPASTNRFE